ncbi:hypothetical protein D3C87_1696880 [compost metagenome]
MNDVVLERTTQNVVALAADRQDLDCLALRDELQGMIARQTNDRGVETAGKAALAGGNDQEMNLILAGSGKQKRCTRIAGVGSRKARQYLVHPLCVRTGGFGRFLRTTQLRRGDHFHRLGDLLRRLDGGDPVLQILK